MQQYTLSFKSPLTDPALFIVLLLATTVLIYMGFSFIRNIKTGVTLIYTGWGKRFIILKGKPDENTLSKLRYSIIGEVYVSPTKCLVYGILFWIGALIAISATFVSLNAI